MTYMNQFRTNISLPAQRTDYIIGSNLLANLHQIKELKDSDFSSFLLLSDTNIFKLYGKKVVTSLKNLKKPIISSFVVPGEEHKVLNEMPKIVKPYFEAGFGRNAALVALGGGVITDLGGFIASILLRGISAVYLPTTLLGQIDAAIGGKTGVDFRLSNDLMIKNMIGTIRQPSMVISDIDTFRTLPEKEILNGLSEMVKYWVGWGKPTPPQMKALKAPRGWQADPPAGGEAMTPPMVKELIKTIFLCQKIKLDTVQQDPLEAKGLRQKLNLGHTIGHAIEGAANGKLSHGQAVSIGLASAARISRQMGLLSKKAYLRIIKQLTTLGLPINIKNLDRNKVLQALRLDKKAGSFVLIKDIGKLVTGVKVDPQLINKVIEEVII